MRSFSNPQKIYYCRKCGKPLSCWRPISYTNPSKYKDSRENYFWCETRAYHDDAKIFFIPIVYIGFDI